MFFFINAGVARSLALAGYAVYGMDYPGHGLSEGLHTYIPDFDKLVDDVMEQYTIIKGSLSHLLNHFAGFCFVSL